MGWEVASGVTLVIIALMLVPRYLKQGITTIPDFLESRYDMSVKKFVTLLFLVSVCYQHFADNTYTQCAVVLGEIFDVQALLEYFRVQFDCFDFSHYWFTWLLSTRFTVALRPLLLPIQLMALVLIIGGLMIPVFGLMVLGDGSFGAWT